MPDETSRLDRLYISQLRLRAAELRREAKRLEAEARALKSELRHANPDDLKSEPRGEESLRKTRRRRVADLSQPILALLTLAPIAT